ncbi:MAG: hypothetical protein KDA25_13260 [Phycisphaerales bacterium]|nr:hypothetical protein [Phycisphaerales bacterium]
MRSLRCASVFVLLLAIMGCATAPERGSAAPAKPATAVAPAALTHDLLHPGSGDASVCRCDAARQVNGWCDHCGVGYVAATEVPSALLFETLDPHGHELDLDAVTCPTCLVALAYDGWCEACRMGWIDQRAYMTRITYRLGRGRVIDASGLTCESCLAFAEGYGWCGLCGRGLIGNVAFADRAVFDEAVEDVRILDEAIRTAAMCDLCGCAIVVDGTCPICGIEYRAGRPVFDPVEPVSAP